MKRTIAILGGDQRQVCLAELLLEDGQDVLTWGLEQGGAPDPVPLNQALEAEILILPLPVCRGGKLNLPLTDTELDMEQLWPRLRYNQLLLGGMTGELSARLMADFGLTLLDYYDREETQVANAVPTALAIGHTAGPLRSNGPKLPFIPFCTKVPSKPTTATQEQSFGDKTLQTNDVYRAVSGHCGSGAASVSAPPDDYSGRSSSYSWARKPCTVQRVA